MSDNVSKSSDSIRARTSTRMRFVAPPGVKVDEQRKITTIGRYEILKTLGKGAMGVVYKARDPLLDRIVAVKTIMSPSGTGKRIRTAYIERFEREAKAAAKMQHPSIVTIFDVGVEGEAPFMVLEYLPGESLADRLDRVRLPLGKAVQIGQDLANALAFAHRQRIVHRDVKPANVLHAGENRWKLADFGIARLPDSDLTQVGIFMGTPGYSPPEAIRHGHYTAQADVFAWGALLYEMLSGRIPYEGPDTKTTNGYVLKGLAPPVTQYDPSIPQPLADVVMRALASSMEERYKDGAEAEEALRTQWEYCLNEGLIPTSCLTSEEVPHERVVGGAMHRGRVPKPAPAAPPLPEPRSQKPVLVIESSDPPDDDDAPTRVIHRDQISGPHSRPQLTPSQPMAPASTGLRSSAPGMDASGTGTPSSPAIAGAGEPPAMAPMQVMDSGSVSQGLGGRRDGVHATAVGNLSIKRSTPGWVWLLIIAGLLAAGAVVVYQLGM